VLIFRQNNRGFTLVEVMVAMLITLVGVVGLLKSIEVAMEHNLKNQLRDEAVLVGEKAMASQKVRPFAQISSSRVQVGSRLRSAQANFYTVTLSITPWPLPVPPPTVKQVIINVGWNHKGTQYTHEIRSVRSE
jgi:type IV pilus assembly protein PilV